MLALLVSLGHNGSRSWIIGNLAEIYGQRHDMLPMLRSASAPGRAHVLLATDELVPGFYFFNDPPPHVAAVRTQTAKLGDLREMGSFYWPDQSYNPANGVL